jgi:WD40 repeat protein
MALLEGHIGPVWSLSYSRGSGSLLATGGADRTVRLFSCPRGESLMDLVNEELSAADAVPDLHAKDPAAAAAAAAGGTHPVGASGRAAARVAAAAAAAGGGAAGAAAAAAAVGSGGGAGGGHMSHSSYHAPTWQPYQQLKTFTTQSMPVVYVDFSPRNLLLAGGPWTLQPKVISSGQHTGTGAGR